MPARVRLPLAQASKHCPTHHPDLRQSRSRLWLHTTVALLCLTQSLRGQTAPVATTDSPYTLHVYQDLVQLPTFVLNSRAGSYPGLTAPQFTLRLDGGPPFHPRHARLQGDDPLQIALVFDTSEANTRALAQTVADAAPDQLAAWLNPTDELSVYALDCHLVRSSLALPYTALRLHWTLTAALASTDLHKHDKGAGCGYNRRLWDSLVPVIRATGQQPGRRIVIVVSDGTDRSSKLSWIPVARYAGSVDTTILGLRLLSIDPGLADSAHGYGILSGMNGLSANDEEAFNLLCAKTGGPVFPVRPETVLAEMHQLVDLLRQRYILEFPRPRRDAAGIHQVVVTVPDPRTSVFAAGIAFPPRPTQRDTDPATIASDPTQAPTIGDRKMLNQPQ